MDIAQRYFRHVADKIDVAFRVVEMVGVLALLNVVLGPAHPWLAGFVTIGGGLAAMLYAALVLVIPLVMALLEGVDERIAGPVSFLAGLAFAIGGLLSIGWLAHAIGQRL